MTNVVRPQTLMLSDSICLPGNKGHMRRYLKLRQLLLNILSELHTRQAVFGVSQRCVKPKLKILQNRTGNSKIALGKHYGQPNRQLPKAVNSQPSVAVRLNAVEDVSVINFPFHSQNCAAATVKININDMLSKQAYNVSQQDLK